MFNGLILKESLLSDRTLEMVQIVKREVWRDIPGAVEGQPKTWTALRVSVEADRIHAVLEALAQDLKSEPIGWYADFSDGQDTYIVFPGRAFSVRKEGKEAAVQYGLSLGIPKHQLDF